jgi:hypothetical protein
MIDQAILDLINKQIDGVCTPEESSRLQEILRTDPEAKKMHGDLQFLTEQMDSLSPAEPPRTLKPAILRALDARHRPHHAKTAAAGWFAGWNVRPVLAAAGGAIAGIALYVVISSAIAPSGVSDVDLSGTLILHGSNASFTPGPALQVRNGETSATIETNYSDGLCLLRLRVDSPAGVSATLRIDPETVRLEAVRPIGNPAAAISVRTGEVHMDHALSGGLAVLVAVTSSPLPPSHLTLVSDGKVLFDEDIAMTRK